MDHISALSAKSQAERAAEIFTTTMRQCGGREWRETLVSAEMRTTLTQIARGFDGRTSGPGSWVFPDGSLLSGGWLFPTRIIPDDKNALKRSSRAA